MTLPKRVPSFATMDMERLTEETANVPEQVSNALTFVTVKVDASTTWIINKNTHHVPSCW